MKKGCFLTLTVLFTLIVGAAVYFFKYKKDFIKEFSKTKVLNLAMDEFDKKLENVQANMYKDSLRTEMHNYLKSTEKIPFDTAIARMQRVIAETQHLIKDKMIDSSDFNNFKKYLAGYERSKKN